MIRLRVAAVALLFVLPAVAFPQEADPPVAEAATAAKKITIKGDNKVPVYTLAQVHLEGLGADDSEVWDIVGMDRQGDGDGITVAASHSYIFTGPPGHYRITATALIKGKLVKYRLDTEIVGLGPGPVPPIPIPGIDRDGDGIPDDRDPCPDDSTNKCNDPAPPTPPTDPLSKSMFDAAMSVTSSNRAAEAKQFAGVFRAVAGEAAGVSSVTLADMLAKLKAQMGAIPAEVRSRWTPWQTVYVNQMRSLGLSTKEQHIDAFNRIAAGLEAAR